MKCVSLMVIRKVKKEGLTATRACRQSGLVGSVAYSESIAIRIMYWR